MNWLIIIVIGILAIALISFLVIRNQKDENKFIDELNNDYSNPDAEERDDELDKSKDNIH